jgi:hypothetical protein
LGNQVTEKEGIMTRKSAIAIVGAGVLCVLAIVSAQEQQIKRSDLPPAVEKTVSAQSAGAEVRGFSQENEHGQIFYEAEMTVNGHSKAILIDEKGNVVEVEEEVAMEALPTAVKSGLTTKQAKGRSPR